MTDASGPSGGQVLRVSGIEPHTNSIGITRFHIQSSYLEWDPRAAAIFAADNDDRPAIEIWHSRVHPDDTDLLRDLYSDACASIGAECVYRIVIPRRGIRHVMTRSVAIERDPDGTPTVLTGVVSLIEPRQGPVSGERLTSILDHVSLGFAILDEAMVVHYINTQSEQHLGIARADIVGRHLHEVLPQMKGTYFDDLHADAIATRTEVKVEVEAVFLPGRTMEVTANYVDGVVAVSFRDVTDAAVTTTRLLEAYRELLVRSRLDDLTGVLNRAALFERIERISAEAAAPAALLFIDLDDFKAINDTYGHLIGDQVLRTIAHRLSSTCDSNNVLGRIGGDEFVAALFGDTLSSGARSPERVAADMHAAVAMPIRVMDADLTVSISIGIARSHYSDTLEDLLTRADVALYEAKTGVRRIGLRSTPPPA